MRLSPTWAIAPAALLFETAAALAAEPPRVIVAVTAEGAGDPEAVLASMIATRGLARPLTAAVLAEHLGDAPAALRERLDSVARAVALGDWLGARYLIVGTAGGLLRTIDLQTAETLATVAGELGPGADPSVLFARHGTRLLVEAPAGAGVRINGRVAGAGPRAELTGLAPGDYEVSAVLPGGAVRTERVTLASGATAHVHLGEEALPAGATASSGAGDRGAGGSARWWVWVAVGGGAVAVGLSVALAVALAPRGCPADLTCLPGSPP